MQWHYLRHMASRIHLADLRQSPSHRRMPVSRKALGSWVPALPPRAAESRACRAAGTTLHASRLAQLLVAELVVVDAKSQVSDMRNELPTAGYALLHLRGSYNWGKARVDFGIGNLFNRFPMPLGGAYVGQGGTMGINTTPWGIAVPGMGRSLYAGVT